MLAFVWPHLPAAVCDCIMTCLLEPSAATARCWRVCALRCRPPHVPLASSVSVRRGELRTKTVDRFHSTAVLVAVHAARRPSVMRGLSGTVGCAMIALVPLLFQMHAYAAFCPSGTSRMSIHDSPPQAVTDSSPWCYNTVPIAYTYVQATYWGVGLFRYYTWQQV